MCRKYWLLPILATAVMLFGASQANADKQLYPASEASRNLNSGPAGWTARTSSEGLCVPVVLCPVIQNSVQSSGGSGGAGGYLRTAIGSLTGVGATSTGTHLSPRFKYRGVAGEIPDSVELGLARRSDVESLLSVGGNSATFSITLIDTSNGSDVLAVPPTELSGADSFTKLSSGRIDPDQLKLGHRYRIAITSRFENGAEVLPGGTVGYDNVVLRARRDPSRGNDQANDSDAADEAGGVVTRIVRIKGRFVVAKVRCSAKPAKRKCKSRLHARLTKRGAKVTSTQRSRVRAGRSERVKLRIRGKYRDDVASAKRLTIKRQTRVAGKVATTYTKARVKG